MAAVSFTFGTFCSGIEAASEAFIPLGAECAFVAEIEPYPCGVLADRHGAGKPMRVPSPNDEGLDQKAKRERQARIKALDRFPRWANRLPNYGDLTQIVPADLPAVDLIVAGTPCQAFSIAGLRQSLSDSRGNLTLHFVKVIHELVRLGRVRSILWENVPDVLNTKDNAFGAFLGGIVGHDAPIPNPLKRNGWPNAGVADGPLGTAAWRVLDAQYAGLAQRRERVFLVASFGDGPDPVEVLLEREGLSRNPPARGQAGEGVARPLAAGSSGSGGYRNDADTADNLVPVGPQRRAVFGGNRQSGELEVHTALSACNTASGRQDFETEAFIVEGPVTYSIMPQNSGKDYKARVVDVAQPLMASGPVGGDQGGDYVVQPVAFNSREDPCVTGDVTGSLGSSSPQAQAIAFSCKDYGGDAGPISPTLRSMSHAGSHANAGGQVAIAFSLRGREGGAMPEVEAGDVCPGLRAADGGSTRPFVAFDETQITSAANRSNPKPGDPCHPLAAGARPPTLAGDMAVRRITPLEAERLQGFREGYTLIDWPTGNRKPDDLAETVAYLIGHGYSPVEAAALAQTPDGPRYKALGNSKAVPLVRKIGERYAAALARFHERKAAA